MSLGLFTDVSKEHSFETSVTTPPIAEHHIPEDLSPKLCSVYIRMATERSLPSVFQTFWGQLQGIMEHVYSNTMCEMQEVVFRCIT